MKFTIDLTPTAASRPRIPKFGKPYYNEPYNSYKNILKVLIGKEVIKSKRPLFKQYEPLKLHVTFYMPFSKGTSKKKMDEMLYHTKKPDADNLLKAIKDGMNDIIYHDDGQVCELEVRKYYVDGFEPRTEVQIYKINV